jgi:formylmethanofuran dehydrogenase subunit E
LSSKPDAEQLNHAVKRAVEFHGHLGPFLVIGVKMGLLGRNAFNDGCSVEVRTSCYPPLSCVIDGVQVSSGSTVGNGRLVVKDADSEVSAFFKGNGGGSLKILLKNEVRTDLLETCKRAGKAELETVAHRMVEAPMEKIFALEEHNGAVK